MSDLIVSERLEHVTRLTLNSPASLNALSDAMLAALSARLATLAEDRETRVVILRGAGKAFCAGHDLKEMRAEPSLEYYQRLFAQCAQVMLAIQRLPVQRRGGRGQDGRRRRQGRGRRGA